MGNYLDKAKQNILNNLDLATTTKIAKEEVLMKVFRKKKKIYIEMYLLKTNELVQSYVFRQDDIFEFRGAHLAYTIKETDFT